MSAIGMLDAQVLRHAVERVNLGSSFGDGINAAPFEIGVAERRIYKNLPWRERADEFVEVKRNFVQTSGILHELGHVARLAPAAFRFPNLRIATIIIGERIKAAA